jgi:hypothetical protein
MFAEQVQVRAAATGEHWWQRLYPVFHTTPAA